jgi:acyl carrier protein
MLAKLGELAQERRLERVDVNYVESGKNRPAREFLDAVGAKYKEAVNGSYLYRFPAEFAAAVTFTPPAGEPMRSSETVNKEPGTAISALQSSNGSAAKSELMSRIAKDLCTTEEVLKAVESQNRRSRPELGETYVAPRNPAEQTLAVIWADVLRLERIGVHDNFFELGGHSLLATVLISRMRDTFQVEFSVPDFFDAPTIAGLAGVIERYQIQQADAEEVAEMLTELDELSDEEVRALLANESQSTQDSERM